MGRFFNRLRKIAGFTLWGFAVVLFIAWVRSYFEMINVRTTLFDRKFNMISMRGELGFSSWPAQGEDDWIWMRNDVPPNLFPGRRLSDSADGAFITPYWLLVSVTSLLSMALLFRPQRKEKQVSSTKQPVSMES